VLGSLTLALVVLACGGDDDGARATAETTSPTAPPRPTTTTSTIYDPATTEGQVEAAYLKSWDVYADAVYNLELDEAALESVYGGEHLATARTEIGARIRDGRAALVRVEHSYDVEVLSADQARLTDTYRNHQQLIDPMTKRPVEADPNEVVTDVVDMRRIGARWTVESIRET
jgi:hypothetical protein